MSKIGKASRLAGWRGKTVDAVFVVCDECKQSHYGHLPVVWTRIADSEFSF